MSVLVQTAGNIDSRNKANMNFVVPGPQSWRREMKSVIVL